MPVRRALTGHKDNSVAAAATVPASDRQQIASEIASPTGVMPSQPDPSEVRDALARMTGSDVFSGSPQLIAFLSFVVDAALTGKADRVKGYTIGVEVLHRDPSFDLQIDLIVRVEAGRLRRALKRYYAEAGINDDILITIPPGTYIPTFSERNVAAEEPQSLAQPEGPPRRLPNLRPLTSIAVLTAVAVIVLVSFILWHHFSNPTAHGFVDKNGAAGAMAEVLHPEGGTSPVRNWLIDKPRSTVLPPDAVGEAF